MEARQLVRNEAAEPLVLADWHNTAKGKGRVRHRAAAPSCQRPSVLRITGISAECALPLILLITQPSDSPYIQLWSPGAEACSAN